MASINHYSLLCIIASFSLIAREPSKACLAPKKAEHKELSPLATLMQKLSPEAQDAAQALIDLHQPSKDRCWPIITRRGESLKYAPPLIPPTLHGTLACMLIGEKKVYLGADSTILEILPDALKEVLSKANIQSIIMSTGLHRLILYTPQGKNDALLLQKALTIENRFLKDFLLGYSTYMIEAQYISLAEKLGYKAKTAQSVFVKDRNRAYAWLEDEILNRKTLNIDAIKKEFLATWQPNEQKCRTACPGGDINKINQTIIWSAQGALACMIAGYKNVGLFYSGVKADLAPGGLLALAKAQNITVLDNDKDAIIFTPSGRSDALLLYKFRKDNPSVKTGVAQAIIGFLLGYGADTMGTETDKKAAREWIEQNRDGIEKWALEHMPDFP